MPLHYIAVAGIHGCLPQCTAVGETRTSVAQQMAQIHELSRHRMKALIRDWYLELNIAKDGNEYIEISRCYCDTPEIHED